MRSSLFLGLTALIASVAALPTGGLVRRVQSKTDSGLTVSDVESDWPDEATMTRVLTTKPNKAVFWTGRNGGVSVEGRALLVAKSFGGNTLEGSLAGGNLIMPSFNFGNPKTVEIWTFASQTFAKLATGEAFVVTGRNVREGNIFHKEELPRMKRNKKITKITKIDSQTGRRTVVFERNAKKEDAAINEANLRRDACKEKPPFVTVPRRSNSFRRDVNSTDAASSSFFFTEGSSGLTFTKRAAPAARAARRNTGAAPACPLPGAPQAKKVVARSNTTVKEPKARSFPAGGKKPAKKAPVPKKKVARPANRPKRPKGKPAPARKAVTPKKKPKKVPKPAAKPKGKPRKRR
ncbi:Transposase [Favolaschia claudopus]|uniref:Transposase n=1 Tax=Favolaschia claudopus TaxID=2862362 RepID=A0AAW0CXV1_9AGAR